MRHEGAVPCPWFSINITDWAANEDFAGSVAEAALSQKTPGAVQAACRRTTYLGTPTQPGAQGKLMEAWGSYCAGGTAASENMVSPVETERGPD